ncbi:MULTISPECIES: hypothetical protein [unclassified Corynebacterium]|nr:MULTISPECIES: hypothetical protein [unclassified Corynebacterium]ERS51419.1 hypothetical protein HMPREF1281_01719 [Corynebacterium sp. KPL1855]ERS61612.1 hypothetical protein HMPREF1257_01972 [Corynebacterium sp. KPL1814]ERS79904.1 hypothetical protein HMPREF1285_01119 [Corynebacterium sp. KPL1859]
MQPPHTPDERRAKLEAVKELARRQEHDAVLGLPANRGHVVKLLRG